MRVINSKKGTSKDADQILINLIQRRDEAALALFYERKSGFIYSLVLNIVHTVPDAEEVTQEVFYTMWMKAETYDPLKGSVMAWLTTIARRLAIDRTRSKLYKSHDREISMDGGIKGKSWEDRLADFSDKTTVGTEAREVFEALQKLDEQYREVIMLSYYEGLSHSMIADRLNNPLGTVKSRLREGVARLRRSLDIKVASKNGSQGSI